MSSFATADYGVAVTPHDTNPLLDGRCRALFIGNAGDVNLISRPGGTAVLYENVPAGSTLSVSAYIVLATNTAATGIVALY